jgi:hypothetical protein
MERSSLMAHTTFTRQLEEAFVDMYEQARNKWINKTGASA